MGHFKLPTGIVHSRCFFKIKSLVFSEFRHGVKNSYEVVIDRAGFYGNFFAPKMGEKYQKYSF